MSLDCVIYCACYSIFFGGGAFFSGHGVLLHRAVDCKIVTNWESLITRLINQLIFLVRDSIYAEVNIWYVTRGRAICYSTSVTPVDQSKTDEVRIMQFSPYNSPFPLVLMWSNVEAVASKASVFPNAVKAHTTVTLLFGFSFGIFSSSLPSLS